MKFIITDIPDVWIGFKTLNKFSVLLISYMK